MSWQSLKTSAMSCQSAGGVRAMYRIVHVCRSQCRLTTFQRRKRGFSQGLALVVAQRRNRVVPKAWLASSVKKPLLKSSHCNTQYPAQTQTLQRHTALYGIMAAGRLVRASKHKAFSGFWQRRSQQRAQLSGCRKIVSSCYLGISSAPGGLWLGSRHWLSRTRTAARSQPCAGLHQLYA
jgi:hypothetical protein